VHLFGAPNERADRSSPNWVTEQPVGLQHHTDPRRNGALGLVLAFPARTFGCRPAMINEALQRLLIENLTTATLLLNSRLRLEYMNPAAEMLLAVSGQRSHGQFISELFTESPEALAAL